MEDTNKLQLLRQLLESSQSSLMSANKILQDLVGDSPSETDDSLLERAKNVGSVKVEESGRVVNGIFDGQHMIGPDGKQYSVPANYASKSKLVEGDMLKLTITADGSFVYKQVGPVERSRVVGTLMYDDLTEEWRVQTGTKLYSILLASVTYFKGDIGDEVVLLVPKEKESKWGAVENIIKAGQIPQNVSEEQEVVQPEKTDAAEGDLDEI